MQIHTIQRLLNKLFGEQDLQILENPELKCFDCLDINCGFLLIKYLLNFLLLLLALVSLI